MKSAGVSALMILFMAGSARAGFVVNPFAPSVYDSDTAAMDAALGITGFDIEDFEDTTLVAGLSYTLTDPSAGTFSALPATFDPSPFWTNNTWDGSHVLLNNSMNDFSITSSVEGTRTDTITFNFASGATSFGIGLAGFQSLSLPSGQFPVADHELFINGVSQGKLENLVGWVPGPHDARNLYLRIDATAGDVINSLRIANVDNLGSAVDLLVFDHIAIQPATSTSVVPEPSSLVLLGIGGVSVVGFGWRKRRRDAWNRVSGQADRSRADSMWQF